MKKDELTEDNATVPVDLSTSTLVPVVIQGVQNLSPDYALQKNAISRAYYKISSTGKKLLLMAMASNSLKKGDTSFESSFFIADFMATMGIKKGGETSKGIMKAAEEVAGLTINFHQEDFQNWITMFSAVQYDEKKKAFNFIYNPLVNKFLENQKGRTKIELEESGKLNSVYAMRFYEFFKSYAGFAGSNGNEKNTWFVNLTYDEIRRLCRIEPSEYQDRSNFKSRVIDKPLKEINEKISSFEIISKEPIKENGKIIGLKFKLLNKDPDLAGVFGFYYDMVKKLASQNKELHKQIVTEKELFMVCAKDIAETRTSKLSLEYLTSLDEAALTLLVLDTINDFRRRKEQKEQILEEAGGIEPLLG